MKFIVVCDESLQIARAHGVQL